MKKYRILAILLVIMSFALMAQEFTYELAQPEIRHARIDALGGKHISDTSWYYSFLTNPGNIGHMGKKSLYPGLTVGIGGPIKYTQDIIAIAKDMENDDSISSLAKILSENKGLDLDLVISGPIQFGSVKNNFGWGFFNQTYVIANAPSISYLEGLVGNESLLRLGFALPIPLGIGKLSVGGAVDLVNRVEGKLLSSVTNLMSGNPEEMIIPLYSSFGFGLDVGATLSLLNFITVGLVWDDAVSGYFTSKSPNLASGELEPDASYKAFNFGWKFDLGASVSVPGVNIFTLGVISSLDVMLDLHDVIGMMANDPKKRNPILDVSLGTEAVFFKTISLRLGIHEMYPSAGIGARFGAFNLDAAIFGRELGLEPGTRSQLNLAFSLEFFK